MIKKERLLPITLSILSMVVLSCEETGSTDASEPFQNQNADTGGIQNANPGTSGNGIAAIEPMSGAGDSETGPVAAQGGSIVAPVTGGSPTTGGTMANAGIGIAGGSGIVAAEGGQSDSSGETSDAAVAPVQDASDNADAAIAECLGAHQFTVESVDVGQQSLCDYQGDVLLIVNIAANCGLTALPQGFPGLVQLQTSYSGEGFKVLGVWSNQFANQMGSPTRQSQVISDFGVNFPLFAETNVNPPNEHPLFTWLKAEAGGGNVGWNFEKFLVARDGSFIKRYLSQSTPDQIVADIEAAL